MNILEVCCDATSLYELNKRFCQQITRIAPRQIERMRWMLAEFPRMNPEERTLLHSNFKVFHEELTARLQSFVDDPLEASWRAWLMMSAAFGFNQLFWNLDLRLVANISVEEFVETFASILSSGDCFSVGQ